MKTRRHLEQARVHPKHHKSHNDPINQKPQRHGPSPHLTCDCSNRNIQQYLDTHCSLGEGPFYDPATQVLRFVDMENNEIHTVSLEKGPSSHRVLAKLSFPAT